tara:strand:+ start:641 stop:811 length:171 start_codon:yes stop_codon:yes gene_type:complete
MYKLSPILEETYSQLSDEDNNRRENENILYIILSYPFYLFNLFLDCLKGVNELNFD